MDRFELTATAPLARNRNAVRPGTTVIELLVSFSLLTTVLGVSVPLVVRHGRLLTSARHYRLALDELSNQAERLSTLPVEQVQAEIEKLQPSEFATSHLHGAKLEGKLESADRVRRVRMQIYWDEPQRREVPVTLVAWLPSEAVDGATATTQRSEP
jgi:hypothetical protein